MIISTLLLLNSWMGPYVIAWALVMLIMSATMRFRWSALYAVAGVVSAFAALVYYMGKQPSYGANAIEGPELFGAAFALNGFITLALATLGLGGVVALIRRSCLKDHQKAEHY